jgi:hypothetical protein
MKPIRIFLDPDPPIGLEEGKHTLRTLADIAGLAIHFVSNPNKGPFDLSYCRDPNQVNSRIFIPMFAKDAKCIFDLCKLKHGKVDYDIVLTAFNLISGLHEVGMTKDFHDHHHIESSVLYQKDILHVPLVNQYGAILREAFSSNNPIPMWPEGKTWAASITHDVDYPKIIRWIEILRYVIANKVQSKLCVIADIIAGRNHFWKFQDWMDLETKYGVRSAFYFCGRKGSLMEYLFGTPDPFYDVRSEEFREVIGQLKTNGFEVGLHASYNAFKSAGTLKSEMQAVEDSLDEPLTGNRHHYWHLNQDNPAETTVLHEEVGLFYDSSICYERRAGFRYGIASPFRIFHKNKKQPSTCLQLPTAFMDDHMYRHMEHSRFKTPHAEIDSLIDQTKNYTGLFIVDYHVRRLNDTFFPGWGKLFQYVLEIIANDPQCFCDTPEAIAKYWGTREKKLRSASFDECYRTHH